jgi:hypothetical protein
MRNEGKQDAFSFISLLSENLKTAKKGHPSRDFITVLDPKKPFLLEMDKNKETRIL